MKTLFIVKMISAFLVSQLFVFGNGMAYSIENPLHVTPIPNKTVLKVESIGANRSTLSFKRLLNTSGKVYSIQQGKKTSAESNTKKVKVVIEKTDGKAKTEVRVCLLSEGVGLGLTTVKKTYVFENGNYTRKKTFTVFGAKGQKVVVYIDNKSVGNTFSYTLYVDEI